MTYSKIILSLLTTTVLTTGLYAQKTTGKLVLAKGQKFNIDNVVSAVISMEAMGQALEITTDATTATLLQVSDVTKTSATVSSSITKLKTSNSMMGQETNFDSDKKEDLEGELGGKLKGLLNNPKTVELDLTGKVIQSNEKDTADKGSDEMNMLNQLMNSYGDDSYGASAAFLLIPANKKVGDSWSDSSSMEGIQSNYTYTLKTINGKEATVTIAGKQKINKKVQAQGMETTVEAENTITGESIVFVTTGIVKTKTLTIDGTGTTDVMGQSIPLTSKSTTSTTVSSL